MNALVMYDHQTRTLWSQFLGRGVQGPLKDLVLEFVPVSHTTWEGWRDLNPDTLVLDKGGRYQYDSYDSYYNNRSAGVMGEFRSDDRVGRKDLVVGVAVEQDTKAYPLRYLGKMPVVNDSLGGRDVLVVFDRATGTALAYDRRLDGRTLTFELATDGPDPRPILVDRETSTRWLALTGGAIEGELKGRVLERTPSHISFWFAWKDWNPDTEVFHG